MNIVLINRITNTQYWLSSYGKPTLDYNLALYTNSLTEIKEYVERFILGFKIIIIVAETGEVIKKY